MFNNLDIEENMIYEVLVTTYDDDKKYNTKPFGITFKENNVILNLYPNNTLNNIKRNSSFMIQLSSNPLMFTKALLDKLDVDDYDEDGILKKTSYIIYANATDYVGVIHEDKHGDICITRTTAEITDIIKINNSPSIINRATSRIMELLVKLSRLQFMTNDELLLFEKEVDDSLRFIVKVGNQDHIDSLTLIKQELNKNKENY